MPAVIIGWCLGCGGGVWDVEVVLEGVGVCFWLTGRVGVPI